MNWLKRLFGRSEVIAPDRSGVLFGLDPPDGCQFQVSCYHGSSWHVRITRAGRTLAHECSLINQYAKPDDERLIVRAAKAALKSVERNAETSALEGAYPPKRTGGPQ